MSLVESGWALSLEGSLLVSLAGSVVSLVGPLPDPPPWGKKRVLLFPLLIQCGDENWDCPGKTKNIGVPVSM